MNGVFEMNSCEDTLALVSKQREKNKELRSVIESLTKEVNKLTEENAKLRSQLESKAPGQRKPFNLELALAGDPVVTRSGITVPRIEHFPEITSSDYKVVASVDGHLFFFTESGKFNLNEGDTLFDLFMAPRTETRWFNHFKDGHSHGFSTEEQARKDSKYWGEEATLAIAVPMGVEL